MCAPAGPGIRSRAGLVDVHRGSSARATSVSAFSWKLPVLLVPLRGDVRAWPFGTWYPGARPGTCVRTMASMGAAVPPAPVNETDVRRALEGHGLPPAAYRSAAVLDWEQEHLVGATWLCVGRGTDLGPEERRHVDAGGQGVL